jgi:uncharacterized protein with von Willebrand factor type A (vWA) domain
MICDRGDEFGGTPERLPGRTQIALWQRRSQSSHRQGRTRNRRRFSHRLRRAERRRRVDPQRQRVRKHAKTIGKVIVDNYKLKIK